MSASSFEVLNQVTPSTEPDAREFYDEPPLTTDERGIAAPANARSLGDV